MQDFHKLPIAYGFNKPEDKFCWTTHEFGVKIPPHCSSLMTFQTYSRHNHNLYCFADIHGPSQFKLRDGTQVIRLENDGEDEQTFHFQVDPKLSYSSDVRDLGILVLGIETTGLNRNTSHPGNDPRLLPPEPSDFHPRKNIDVTSVLMAKLLRRFVDHGWLRMHLAQATEDRFILELAFYPPINTAGKIDQIAFRINNEVSVTVPVEQPADPSKYLLKNLPNPCYRGILDCSENFCASKDRLDIDLEWDDMTLFSYQSNHWRGPGSGPLPDQGNIDRVAGHISGHSFIFTGATWFVKLERLAQRFLGCGLGEGRILDWGCGCARISRFFPPHLAKQLYGVDIDTVNINWCKRYYTDGNFVLIQSNPPMPFPDAYFSLIYGHSVFTHLGEKDQFHWLEELARVLMPGGLLFVTVLAELSWFVRFYPDRRTPEGVASYLDHGFFDDGWLNVGVDSASAGSYRSVSHTEDYIQKHWSRYFEVCEFIPGFADLQTLVVLRKRM